MEESKKIQFIIWSSITLLFLVVVFLFVKGCSNMSKEKKTTKVEDVSTSVRDNTQASDIADVISSSIVGNSNEPLPNSFANELANEIAEQQDAERVQAALREQMNNRGQNYQEFYGISEQPIQEASDDEKIVSNHSLVVEETKQKIRTTIEKKTSPPDESPKISSVVQDPKKKQRFFSGNNQSNSLPYFEVFGEQRIKSGDRLKLIAPKDIQINNWTIPRGTVVYGRATINNRVDILIESINISGKMYAFNKTLFDNDGIPGINIGQPQEEEEDVESTIRTGEEIVNAVPIGSGVAGSVLRTVGSSISVLLGKNKTDIEIIIQSNYKLYLQ